MLRKLIYAIAYIAVLGLVACGSNSKTSLLEDISGVWKASSEQTLMTIKYSDKKITLLLGDILVPVSIGEIDEQNRTVNLNVRTNAGELVVWTIRQILDSKEKSTFHLAITLHDGTQDEFSFVRNVLADDLKRITSLEPKSDPALALTSAQSDIPSSRTKPSPAAASIPQAAEAPSPIATTRAPSPSFDCQKAATRPEMLICANQELAALDIQLMQLYKQALNSSSDKESLKKEQREWRVSQRDTCSTESCISKAYESRIEDLEAISQYQLKPAQFR